MATKQILKTVIFMGSARDVIPPWGGDSRVGDRVLNWVKTTLASREGKLGDSLLIEHDVTVLDPLEVFGPEGALSKVSAGELRAPLHFIPGELPAEVQALKDVVTNADCYILVSAEYNHVMPPGLSSLLGHFPGSCFAYKPSGIVTYSPGIFGGQRGAMSICVMAHELGCLPVNRMVGIPVVHEVFNVDGTPVDPNNRLLGQLPSMLDQLEWMAIAMKKQRDEFGIV
jgi:NAD(P)H-dependent FMN reductase